MCKLGVEMVSGNKDDNNGVARATIKKSSSRPHFLLFMSKILELLVMRLFFSFSIFIEEVAKPYF